MAEVFTRGRHVVANGCRPHFWLYVRGFLAIAGIWATVYWLRLLYYGLTGT